MANNDQVQKYYDALLASYDALSEAVVRGADRGIRVSRQFAADIAAGQREALELGRKYAGEPTDLGQFYTSVLEATTSAQGRALAFAQTAYEEAVGASKEGQETLEKVVRANQDAAKAAVGAFQAMASNNPMSGMFEAFTPAKNGKKAKAAASA